MAARDPFSAALSGSDSDTDNASPTFVARSPDKTEKLEDQSFGRFRAEADKMQQRIPLSEALVAEAAEDLFVLVTPKKRIRKRKAAAAESATPQKTQRLPPFADGLKLTELDIKRAVVPSVVVPSFQSVIASHCIPLWQQFKAS